MHAAIYFQSDGYVLDGVQIVGRRMAGAAFLRAAVEGREGATLHGFAPLEKSGDNFIAAVRAIDPAAQAAWIPGHRLDLLAKERVLYRPDNVLGPHARLRLRAGPAAFSICGVTHTISTDTARSGLADLLAAPVMGWDALICTSGAARAVVTGILEAEADYQRWMGRETFRPDALQLPVIPLGVHSADLAGSAGDRAAARASFDIGEDEVVFLFAGRLSFSAKAHPYQMLRALQAVAERSGRRITLLQAGQFSNPSGEAYYRQAVRDYCPDVRCLFVDGALPDRYRAGFAAADVFLSLADSIQETFGLTPVEAMAAGLPAVVSDWNGYKETVRDGIDGFRIRSWAPEPGSGNLMAVAYEAGLTGTEQYQSRASTTVSIDMAQLVDRLAALAGDPDLRRRMGAAGEARARGDYDWAVIYRRYRDLWAELDAIRTRALADPATRAWLDRAPRAQAAHLDPHSSFAVYPTAHVGAATLVRLAPGVTLADYQALAASLGFRLWKAPPEAIGRIFSALAAGPRPAGQLAARAGIAPALTIELASRLAKMNLVVLGE